MYTYMGSHNQYDSLQSSTNLSNKSTNNPDLVADVQITDRLVGEVAQSELYRDGP